MNVRVAKSVFAYKSITETFGQRYVAINTSIVGHII